MSSAAFNRPDTTMGRALAARALSLAQLQEQREQQVDPGLIDLTTPAVTQLPEHIRQAAKDALDRGETHYTSRPGVTELRRAIAERSTRYGFPATADSVVVTNGGSEAIYIALQATLSAGDRAMIVEPVAPNIGDMISFIGADTLRVSPSADKGFALSQDDLLAANANVLLLASPNPISGREIPSAELEAIIRAAIEGGMVVILDRSYETARYDGEPAIFGDTDLAAKLITIGSFSTGYGMGGWRVGYFTAPEDRMGKLRGLKQAMSICTTAVSQFAALAALEGPQEWLDDRRERFARLRDEASQTLQAAGLSIVEPDAYASVLVDVRSSTGNDRDAAASLAEQAGVVVEPGSFFGSAAGGFVRIDLGVDEVSLRDGVDRLARQLGNGANDE